MSKTLLPDGFAITPEMRAWARRRIPNFDIDSEHEHFCDWWKSRGKKMADWTATWRVWMWRAPEFARGHRNTRPLATVEMPFERGERTPGPPVQIRDHPLFKKVQR